MNNEEKILSLLENLTETVNRMGSDISVLKEDVSVLKEDVVSLKEGQARLEKRQDRLDRQLKTTEKKLLDEINLNSRFLLDEIDRRVNFEKWQRKQTTGVNTN